MFRGRMLLSGSTAVRSGPCSSLKPRMAVVRRLPGDEVELRMVGKAVSLPVAEEPLIDHDGPPGVVPSEPDVAPAER